MTHEVLDINKDNIATDSFLTVLANLLERYNQLVNDTNNTLNVDNYKKVLTDINEAFSLYAQLKNTVLDQDVSTVQTLQTEINTLIQSINTSLTNGEFVGAKGDKGDQGVQGLQGIQGVQGLQGIQGEPGTTDYNFLDNKPYIPLNASELDDYEEGTFVPIFDFSNFASGLNLVNASYVKIGNIVGLNITFQLTGVDGDFVVGDYFKIDGLPFSMIDTTGRVSSGWASSSLNRASFGVLLQLGYFYGYVSSVYGACSSSLNITITGTYKIDL